MYVLDVSYIYVAFKCFMLHVFLAVWRVKGHGGVTVVEHGCRGMGRGEPADVARGTLGAGGLGQEEARCACGAGRTDGGGKSR